MGPFLLRAAHLGCVYIASVREFEYGLKCDVIYVHVRAIFVKVSSSRLMTTRTRKIGTMRWASFSSARHYVVVFLSQLPYLESGLQCDVICVRVRAILMEIASSRSSDKDSNKYKTPYVSPQASSESPCRCTADLYLVSFFSSGYIHQSWPRPSFAAIRYRASDHW